MKRPLCIAVLASSLSIARVASADAQDQIAVQIERAEAAEKIGDIVLAREHYRRAVELVAASADERGDLARDRFASLDARVPRLTVRLLVGTAAGTVVTRDGVALGSGVLGQAIPVRPGRHEVVVEAAQHVPRTFVVTLVEGDRKALDVSPGAGAFRANGAGPNAAAGDTEDSEHTLDFSRRTVGLSLGGAGVGALGIGTVFGVVSLSSAGDEADGAGRIATGFLIGGAIAAIAGAIIYFTAPSSH